MSDPGDTPADRSPGELLRAARLEAGLTPEEVALRLNWLPGNVETIEGDDYRALRNPSFARGYVRAYGKLVGVNELRLRHSFDDWQLHNLEGDSPRQPRRPLHLQRTGKGVVVGLTTLGMLVAALWWQGGRAPDVAPLPAANSETANQLSVGK